MENDNEKPQTESSKPPIEKERIPPPPNTKTREARVTYVTKSYKGKPSTVRKKYKT